MQNKSYNFKLLLLFNITYTSKETQLSLFLLNKFDEHMYVHSQKLSISISKGTMFNITENGSTQRSRKFCSYSTGHLCYQVLCDSCLYFLSIGMSLSLLPASGGRGAEIFRDPSPDSLDVRCSGFTSLGKMN